MFYQVVEEKCEQGIKPRYSKNQRINDVELSNLMNDFKNNRYEIRTSMKKKIYEFFDYNWYGEKVKLYFLELNKIK